MHAVHLYCKSWSQWTEGNLPRCRFMRKMTNRCRPSWLSHVLVSCLWALQFCHRCKLLLISQSRKTAHSSEERETGWEDKRVSVRSGLGKCLGPDKLVLHKRIQMLLYYKLSCCSGTDKVQRRDAGLCSHTQTQHHTADKGSRSRCTLCYFRGVL